MPGFNIFTGKDIDGRHWKFAQQNKEMSCGPTSIRICKELYHNKPIGEEVMRGIVGMQYSGKSHTGQSYADAAKESDYRWRQLGAIEHMVLPAVKANPLGIPGAKFVHGIANLRNASRNHPAILGFNWEGGGGHFVVCAGPCKTDPTQFVVLDPDGGLQYIDSSTAVGNKFYYNPSYGAKGEIDPVGFIAT